MNAIKKWLGIVWMLLGPVAIYYLIKTAAAEIAKKPVIRYENTMGCVCYRILTNCNWHDYFRVLCCKRGIRSFTGKL
jgi:hypothetical protein